MFRACEWGADMPGHLAPGAKSTIVLIFGYKNVLQPSRFTPLLSLVYDMPLRREQARGVELAFEKQLCNLRYKQGKSSCVIFQ